MTAQVLVAAGESWQWQLRDKDGQWIEMGARVQWLTRGVAQVGTVIGSPKEGLALVQKSDGSEHRVATRWLTKTDAAAPQVLPSRGAAVVAANDGVLDMSNGREYFYTRFDTDLYGIRKKGPTAKKAAVQAVNDQMDVPGDQLKILADLAFPRKFSHIDPEDLQPIVVNELIAQWAETASDSSSLSIALQEAARREFDLPGSTDYLGVSSDVEARVQLILDSSEDVLRAFVRAQHKATVGQLKADGVKTLRLARGTLEAMDAGEQTVRLRPMSSFTVSTHTAWRFATRIGPSYRFGTSPRVTFVEVPVDKILAVPGTGAGCLDEYEFILMGGDYPAIVTEAEKHNPKSVVPPELLPIAAAGTEPIELDTPGIGEDWIKTLSWDLSTDPDDFTQAQLQRLSTLPAWEAAPPQIKAALRRKRGLLAAGESWQWQLRDSRGRWIKMGSNVAWLMRGKMHTGSVVDSPGVGEALVRDDESGTNFRVPAAGLIVTDPITDAEREDRSIPGADGPLLLGDRVRSLSTGRVGSVVGLNHDRAVKRRWATVLYDDDPTRKPNIAYGDDLSHKGVPLLPTPGATWESTDHRGKPLQPGDKVAQLTMRSTVHMGHVTETPPFQKPAIARSSFGRAQPGGEAVYVTPVAGPVPDTGIMEAKVALANRLIVIDQDDTNPYDRTILTSKGGSQDKILAFPARTGILQDQDGKVYRACPKCLGTGFVLAQVNGGICHTCNGAGWSKQYKNMDAAIKDREKARSAAIARVEAQERKEQEDLAKHRALEPPGFSDRLDNAPSHHILDDLREKRDEYGWLTPAQIELAVKILGELDAREAKKIERVAAGIKVPSGKMTVTGTVISTKVKETQYGPRLTMLVESPEGWRVWGSVPKALVGVQAGDAIQFDAGVEPSDRDQTFGFFSRPTKAKRLTALTSAGPITAGGDSWRWQLRDRNGQWIEMGAEVKWLARGRWKFGIVVGSPAPGVATVEEVLTAIRHDIPSARLEVVEQGAALIELVDAIRDEKGRIDWKALNLPRDAATAVIQKAADQKKDRQVKRREHAEDMGVRVGHWLASDKPPWTDPDGMRAGRYPGITAVDATKSAKGVAPGAGRYNDETGEFVITELGLGGDDESRKTLILHEAGHALQLKIAEDIGFGSDPKFYDPVRRPDPVTYKDRNGLTVTSRVRSPFFGGENDDAVAGHEDDPAEILADAIAIILGGNTYQHRDNPAAVAMLKATAEQMKKNGWEHPPLFEKPSLPEWTNWRKGTTSSGEPEWVSRPDGNEVTIRKGYDGKGYRIVAINHQGEEDVYRSGEAKTLAEAKKKGLELLASMATERKDTAKGSVAAGDLKPGSVYTQRRNRDRVRVLRMHPPEESSPDYVTFDGVILDGPSAGQATMVTMKRALQLINESADSPEKQDFDRDVLAPAKALLEGMKTKYPDGLAAAIHQALMPGDDAGGPEPDMSPRLKELGRTTEVVRWQADEAEAKARARELIEEIAHAPASQMLSLGTKIDAAEEKVRQLAAWRVGGVVAEYADLLREHQTAHREWQQRSITTSNKITPHSDGAKRIMADVREIGRMVRVGIDIDIVERGTPSPSPERDKLEAEREDLRKERDALYRERSHGVETFPGMSDEAKLDVWKEHDQRINHLLIPVNKRIREVEQALNKIPDDSVDPEFRDQAMDTALKQRFTKYKRRRELARRAVAELVGVATETKQTWAAPTTPLPKQDDIYGENLGDLDAEQKAAMTQMLLNYPASWVERFDERIVTTSMGTRGWNNGTHIVISNKDGNGLSTGHNSMYATITHEQGHSMENHVPGLKGLEAMFWHDRLGEASQKELYGDDGAYFPHRSTEEHPDNLARPTSIDYTLKTYGNVYSVFLPNWEVFTTGVQEVLGDGKDLYTRVGTDDKDLWEWTMGALLMLDGRSAFTGEGA